MTPFLHPIEAAMMIAMHGALSAALLSLGVGGKVKLNGSDWFIQLVYQAFNVLFFLGFAGHIDHAGWVGFARIGLPCTGLAALASFVAATVRAVLAWHREKLGNLEAEYRASNAVLREEVAVFRDFIGGLPICAGVLSAHPLHPQYPAQLELQISSPSWGLVPIVWGADVHYITSVLGEERSRCRDVSGGVSHPIAWKTWPVGTRGSIACYAEDLSISEKVGAELAAFRVGIRHARTH